MPSSRLEAVSKEDCLTLLRQAAIGRVAVSVGAIPEIFPVNFCLIDDAIVFRAARGTKLLTASRETVVAFEVDDFDVDNRQGWSVLVVGPSDEVTEPEEIATARERLADGWVPGDPDHVLRITPHRVSGRRIATSAEPGSVD
jgi:nitroimidazol reductase NimA-like FMN-containing flavoprotein (pyridoxamine 5'-phosphate oxidase superfamily)